MEIRIGKFLIETERGDIANQQDMDAVVNAANAALTTGGGVAGALHTAAGPGLYKECKPLAPIKPGEAVITGGHNLPNKFVIHCLGPVYGRDEPAADFLENCYKRALELAEENKIRSVAFPAISTGIFGYPLKEAAQIAVETVLNAIPAFKHLQKIKFVLFSEEDLRVYNEMLSEIKK
ncbi:macro domain-containing protein [Salegentibacter chungangensis]|uniref:Macro domain-containing protein n=1 Tax=Salegentibacter chungangensis TaxID=1335724 RepID=A0ABW3NMW1_9FLAO